MLSHEQRAERRKAIAEAFLGGQDVQQISQFYRISEQYIRSICIGEFGKVHVKRLMRQHRATKREQDRVAKQTTTSEQSQPQMAGYIHKHEFYRSIWDIVNWDCQDSAISQVLRVSRERVRQVRRALNKQEPVNKHQRIDRQALIRFIDNNREKLVGKTAVDVRNMYGRDDYTIKQIHGLCAERGIHLKSARITDYSILPWKRMDWRLPNKTLFLIWGNARTMHNIAARRSSYQFGPAIIGEDHPDYAAAVAAETEKAKAWKAGEGRAITMAIAASNMSVP